MAELAGRVAIVTGGGSGIGRALAEALAGQGAFVAVADLNGTAAEEVASSLTRAGHQARSARVDVSRAEEVRDLVERTAIEHGRLDYMFNNAGVAVFGDERDVTLEDWRRVVDTNLWGVVHGTSAAYAVMTRQKSGHIVNTASLAGLIPAPMEISYTATKYAVVGLSRALRIEAADLGVRVSVVCPGLVATPIRHNTRMLRMSSEDVMRQVPLRWIEPAAAARAILRGVERNRAVIVFPLHARFFWWLERRLPAVSALIWRKYTRDIRALRA